MIIFVIIVFLIINAIIFLFSMVLPFIFLVFTFLFYLCIYQMLLKFKQMMWPKIVQSWQQRHWDCISVFDGNFEHCMLNLFFWRSSFEVTLLYFALDNYFFYSVSFNLDLLCCCVICIFVCNLVTLTHWQSFWKEEKYLLF